MRPDRLPCSSSSRSLTVYDAFESGLVKVVRLPDPDEQGRVYLDLWDSVKGTKTKEEYLRECKGAIASIYASWSKDYQEWAEMFEFARTVPSPVLLCVADTATRAGWLFEHLVKEYEFLRNPDDEDRKKWHTIQIDTGVFDADKGSEAILREMVNTDVLNQPLDERPEGYEETVDAFGIPFVGFPVQKRKRARTGSWSNKPVWIEVEEKKSKFRVRVPNVRSWAVSVSKPLSQIIQVNNVEIQILPVHSALG